MKRIVMLLGMLVLLMGCGSKEKEGNENGVTKLVVSLQAVPADAHAVAMDKFKEIVEKETKGSVIIEIHGASSMMTQDAEVPAIMRGNIDMMEISPQQVAEYLPSLSMLTAGYFWSNYDHMNNTLNGEIGEEIFDKVAEKMGARPLAAIYLGSRVINLRDSKGVKTPEDLKGVKLRMPNTPEWLYLGKALGANPTPLAFSELYLSLKTGTVDGQDNPLPTVKNAKFYEVTKSISLTNHVIDSVWITINEKKWEKLSKENQEIIVKAAKDAAKIGSELNIKRESELVSFFEEKGLTIVNPDLDAFKTKAEQMYLGNKDFTSKWDMELYKRIQENK